MDRHDLSEEVTAEHVARLHQEDLKVQDKFNCRALTYWFDDQRKTAFCLVEAPDVESVHRMHDHAHGEVPHSIIEVDAGLVESFLGRIEDPGPFSGIELNIIDEPAFRFLLSVHIGYRPLEDMKITGLASTVKSYKIRVIAHINDLGGTVVRQDGRYLLASFTSALQAVECGLAVVESLGNLYPHLSISLGLDACIPVAGSKSMFEDTIRTSRRLCETRKGFSVSSVVLAMYQEENTDTCQNGNKIATFDAAELIFLHKLLDYLELNFPRAEMSIDYLASSLGLSRSQLFRNAVNLLNCAPNAFLNKFRLEKSLDILSSGLNSVSETAFLCGFSSSSYFSKCFHKMYGIAPKEYNLAMHV